MLQEDSNFESVQVNSFGDLIEVASRIYSDSDLPNTDQVGGLNALILLSAEKNHIGHGTPSGTFLLFNLRALGLYRSEDEESLVNHVLDGRVELMSVVAD